MRDHFCFASCIILWLASLCLSSCSIRKPSPTLAIISPVGASFAETLAARELRRYVYLRTGELPVICKKPDDESLKGLIIIGSKERTQVSSLLGSDLELKNRVKGLSAEQYLLKTLDINGKPAVLVTGGDDLGTLYGAYRLAEILGVRFYLHGDLVPDGRVPLELPEVDETGKPLFAIRGIQPFHDFPEGPDWWDLDSYKAVLAQLPKLRMNFFGLHNYPEDHSYGPEPLVWIGVVEDIGEGVEVKLSYPARHFSTMVRTWGYEAVKTGDYSFGSDALFERDDYGLEYMRGINPWREATLEKTNELFSRTGEFLNEAFTFAQLLGINTCIGTHTPLCIPANVKDHLQKSGKDPVSPSGVEQVYEGIFRRIMQTYPLDYYWVWTTEGWTWGGNTEEELRATLEDFEAFIAGASRAGATFRLATCGWVLGPEQDRTLYDRHLPKDMVMSSISRGGGHEVLDAGYTQISGRDKWAIPWLEDDFALILPQLWVGRMRRDAAQALEYCCTGLLGIHWRTRILGPNISALAAAAWSQQGWEKTRIEETAKSIKNDPAADHLPVDDFYADWALHTFGPEVAGPAARLFASLDGRLPRPSRWVGGPGGITPDSTAWEDIERDYDFVEELVRLWPLVKGAGNLERFDYWLNNFRYLREIAHLRCIWGEFNIALGRAQGAKNQREKTAREDVLPLRKEFIASIAEIHKHLLSAVTTTGGMGTVANWQQHLLPTLLMETGEELARLIGGELPADAHPAKRYQGPPRLFLPAVRTSIEPGRQLKLKVVLLGPKPEETAVFFRSMGRGGFSKLVLESLNRGVYSVTLPPSATQTDLEYYVQVSTAMQETLRFPATAPYLNQTVIVLPEAP